MEFTEVLPFLLALAPKHTCETTSAVDLNNYKAAFNLSTWVPASVIESQILDLLVTVEQLSVYELCKDEVLQAVSLPMLLETVASSQTLMQVCTNEGVEVMRKVHWQLPSPSPVKWHSDKKPTRHLEFDRSNIQPLRLTEFFPEETLKKELKGELETGITTNGRGEDLYVLRNDGVERVYKNNSQYYLQRKSSRKAHVERVQRLQSMGDGAYTPKSRKRGEEEPPASFPPRRQTQRKAVCLQEDRSHIECLDSKFARVSLQDITNTHFTSRAQRNTHSHGGN